MRATDGLQTTINLWPRPQGRSGLLAAAVAGDVPARAVPGRAPPRPDRGVRPSGRPSDPARLFRALIEKADQELVLQNRRGKAGAGTRAGGRGRSPSRRPSARSPSSGRGSATSTTTPSRSPWPGPRKTSHQLHITRNLRDAVCDQFSDRSAGESRAEACRGAGDEDLLGRSTVIDIVHQEGEQLIRDMRARPRGPGRSVRGPVGLARPRCCRPRRPDRVSR